MKFCEEFTYGSVYVPTAGNVQIWNGASGWFSGSGTPTCGLVYAVTVTWQTTS